MMGCDIKRVGNWVSFVKRSKRVVHAGAAVQESADPTPSWTFKRASLSPNFCRRSINGEVRELGPAVYEIVSVASRVVNRKHDEFSASGWPLAQRSPIECDVSECHIEASPIRRPWHTRGAFVPWKKKEVT